MKRLLPLFLVLILIFSCAKEREIEEYRNPEADWVTKDAMTGIQSDPAFWMYRVTVVKTSNGPGFAFVGLQNEAKVGYFDFSREKLSFYNAISSAGKPSQTMTASLLNQWDVTHHDLMLKESDGKITNIEAEEDNKTWDEKRFFKINFAKADVSEAAEFPYYIDAATRYKCWNKQSAHRLDDSLKVTGDHVTFVVAVNYQINTLCGNLRQWNLENFVYTVHYRYSFKRFVRNDYVPFEYRQGETDPLMQKYGYFNTYLEYMGGEDGRWKIKTFMNRWDPTKTHHYYFTKEFPAQYKWMFTDPDNGIFARTNRLFAEQGLAVRFQIHENGWSDNTVKEFGDIRYSFVNFVEEMDTSAPFGYGPSDANPLTGEIVAGNLNMWTGYLKYYMQRVIDSAARDKTKFNESSLFKRIKNVLNEDPTMWSKEMSFEAGSAGLVFNDMLQENTYAYPFWNRFTEVPAHMENYVFRPTSSEHLRNVLGESRHLDDISPFLDEMDDVIQETVAHQLDAKRISSVTSTIYPLESALKDARNMIIDGESYETILNNILYRTAIHEFGHNLNLRHNFYGSVDKKNFPEAKVITDEEGHEHVYPAMSTSVMDYLSLQDEAHLERGWEAYDKAALLYAYSSGQLDASQQYMYCTDEHRPLNAMCNTWDRGSTPSEVLMSMIESYEDRYTLMNLRNGRAYWNTRGYASRIFSTMWSIKRMLLMWRSDFTQELVEEKLMNRPDLSLPERSEIAMTIDEQMKDAINLSLAFYNAVLQQSSADKPWRDEVNVSTGAMERIGILYDKVFAMRFLVGDEGFMYDPNKNINNPSYLTYLDHDQIRPMIEMMYENSVVSRVDMDTWFLSYGRSLFSTTANNYYNSGDPALLNKIKIVKFSPRDFEYYFDIEVTPDLDTEILRLKTSRHPDFAAGTDEVGFTKIEGSFFMVNKSQAPYAFAALQDIWNNIGGDYTVNRDKMDFLELYYIYRRSL